MANSIRAPRVGISRRFRTIVKRNLRRAFELGQRLGITVLPHHFYSSVPDVRALASSTSWRSARSMAGVPGADDLDAQLAILKRWLALPAEPIWDSVCRDHGEPGYGPIESDVLHAFIKTEQPKRVLQVGAGLSTAVVLRGAQAANYEPTVICIDPFPTNYLVERAAAGDIHLITESAQDVATDVYLGLESGDLLFVDSTHTVKPGSEVNRLVLEILPQLPRGVWVHFHDITFPYDYSRGVIIDDLFFWMESTLLHAFLANNCRYTIRVSLSMLHYDRSDALHELLPHYQPQVSNNGMRLRLEPGRHFPSATYLQVVS